MKGVTHTAADALSRNPTSKPTVEDDELSNEIETYIRKVRSIFADYSTTDMKVDKVKQAQIQDSTCKELKLTMKNGWPSKVSNVQNSNVKKFWPVRYSLSMVDQMIVMNGRSVIPQSLQHEMLRNLHTGHQGIVKTKRLARDTIYWPGIDKDI